MNSGTVYVWGKGAHEKPRQDDYQQCSTPYALMEQKQIVLLAFGTNHMMAVDRFRQLSSWGEGTFGCLGLGDTRKKTMPVKIPFFEGKRVIDVSCGDSFTVVIAEVDGDPMHRDSCKITPEEYLMTSVGVKPLQQTIRPENR